MADEEDRTSARTIRYTKVAAGLGGAAVRFGAQQIFGRGKDSKALATDLVKVLGALKGPVMKVAQFMATIPGFLPDDAAAELRTLQADAPAMGWPFVRRRMASELGSDWQSQFQEFERDASAAASLGQVHRATGLDGQRLACKLQYPEMASAIEADLKQLKFAFGLFRRMNSSLDPTEVFEEISDRLREELDYERELKHLKLYALMLDGNPHTSVPLPVAELSTRRLLTMTWLEGEPLLNFVRAPAETRNAIAVEMFKAWWVPFVKYGVIHGDPHLGNYSVAENADDQTITFNLLDFGCIRVFPPSFVAGVVELYHALMEDAPERAAAAYAQWGFADLSAGMVAALNIWARFILGPLMDDRERSIADGQSPDLYGRAEAQALINALKDAGSLTPPREFVFMDRAAIGLGAVFMHLDARVNWHQLFAETVENFDQNIVAQRQQEMLAAVNL